MQDFFHIIFPIASQVLHVKNRTYLKEKLFLSEKKKKELAIYFSSIVSVPTQ